MATIPERLSVLETRIAGLQKLVWLLLVVNIGQFSGGYLFNMFFGLS